MRSSWWSRRRVRWTFYDLFPRHRADDQVRLSAVSPQTHTHKREASSLFSGLGLARYLFPFPLVVYFICRPKSGYPQNLTTSIIGRREAAPAPAVPRDRRPKTFLLLNHTDNVGGKKKKRKLVSFCFPPFLSFRQYHTHTHKHVWKTSTGTLIYGWLWIDLAKDKNTSGLYKLLQRRFFFYLSLQLIVANAVVQISVVARIVTIQVVTRIALPVRLRWEQNKKLAMQISQQSR